MFSDPIVKIILSSTNVELPKLFAKKNITTGIHVLKIKKGLNINPFLLWAHQDLNLGPTDYESVALTN